MIDCKSIAEEIKKECREKIKACSPIYHPYLKIIQVEGDEASNSYTKGKKSDCMEVGLGCKHVLLPNNVAACEVLQAIECGNKDNNCVGIILQLPLPKHLEEVKEHLIGYISNDKDVDGFKRNSKFLPCTPAGIIEILNRVTNGRTEGLHCVVVGRGSLVGKPVIQMLEALNATVTMCNSYTPNNKLKELCLTADVIICATGKPKLITEGMVRADTIVIDAGINRDEDGKLCGDCDKALYEYVENITAVPNGVGLLTRAMLLKNCTKYMEVDE